MSAKAPIFVSTSSAVLSQELDGEMVLLHLDREHYYGLNEAGARMWQLLSQGKSTDEVIQELLGEYEVDEETLRGDLSRLISQLSAAELARPEE